MQGRGRCRFQIICSQDIDGGGACMRPLFLDFRDE